jgi:hypothetical protein
MIIADGRANRIGMQVGVHGKENDWCIRHSFLQDRSRFCSVQPRHRKVQKYQMTTSPQDNIPAI